jgi:hypothetical protein
MQPIRWLLANVVGTACGPTGVDPEVAPDGPAQWLRAQERCQASLYFRIVCSQNYEHTDAPHPLALPPDLILTQNTPQPRQCSNKREGWDALVHDALFH